mmetsp:Transcript_4134/g.6336  ORF Transcript_4134/g.6336 Transcript_4134/m.6336 type:complete len:198 (-) Transcript_4134:85-678(-)|eukprot:scaffold832_cov75-Skeletonema_dohrnii-CCMP3373.AAC.1
MCQVPSRRGAPIKGLLLTCALSFIISSIPLAAVLFVYNPYIIKEQADSSCIAPEILPEEIERAAEVKYRELERAADAQRNELVAELKMFHEENSELRKQLTDATKHFSIFRNDCGRDLARAKHGFEESYRRFEIVQGYFDKCKDQTTRLGKILIDAEKEISNLTKKLTHCNILNNKMEGEMRIINRRNAPGNTTRIP